MLADTLAGPRSSGTQRNLGALLIISIGQFVIALDYSIVYVALPSVGRELDIGSAALQWVVNSYALLFAGLLMLGGRLADSYGPRRVFVISMIGFGVASLLGGIAQDPLTLIGARALQGAAAAALLPAILALLSTSFAVEPMRSRAYSVWGAVGASGLAAGVVLGGVLTTVSWRWTFFINLPLALVAAIGAARVFAPDALSGKAARIPLLATITGTSAVLLVVLSMTFAADAEGGATAAIVTAGVALVALVVFVANERRAVAPLIARGLRNLRSLRWGVIATALYMASVGTEFFLVTLFLQEQRSYTALAAGLAFLPLAVAVTAGNVWAGRLLRRSSAATVLLLGFGLAAGGLVLLMLCLGEESYVVGLLPGFLITGLGHGLIYTSMFVLGTRSVPESFEGAAGSLLTTSQYVAGGIALAVLVIILNTFESQLGYVIAFGFNAACATAGAVLALVVRRQNGQDA